MVKTDDVLFALAAFPLNAHQFFRIDVVAVLRRINAGIPSAGERRYHARAVVVEAPQQYAAALVRIGFLAVLAKRVVMGLADAKQGIL